MALSGGGANGAWQAGVLWGFLHYGNPLDFQYDVLTGISVGSINSVALMVHEKGDELLASEVLSDMWL